MCPPRVPMDPCSSMWQNVVYPPYYWMNVLSYNNITIGQQKYVSNATFLWTTKRCSPIQQLLDNKKVAPAFYWNNKNCVTMLWNWSVGHIFFVSRRKCLLGHLVLLNWENKKCKYWRMILDNRQYPFPCTDVEDGFYSLLFYLQLIIWCSKLHFSKSG